MPNHIQNRLTIVGEPGTVKAIFEHLKTTFKDGDSLLDFNKIKKMPDELSIEIHSGVETAVKIALKMRAHDNELIRMLEFGNRRNQESPLKFNDKDWSDFLQCLNNVRKHGYIYWYDWAIENWGTKWNAYETIDERNTDDVHYFQTAWSSPIELIRLLSEQNPDVVIKLAYADEDSGSNTGHMTFQRGQCIFKYQPPSQSKEGYDLYFELHPDRKSDYKLIGDKYQYIEE